MNIERLKVLIETYGANSARWPEEEQQAALTLLRSSDEANQLMADARQVDQLLDDYSAHTIDTNRLRDQILHSVKTPAGPGSINKVIDWLTPNSEEFLSGIWRPALAAAMTLTLGISIGVATVQETVMLSDSEEIQLLALSVNSYEEWLDE